MPGAGWQVRARRLPYVREVRKLAKADDVIGGPILQLISRLPK